MVYSLTVIIVAFAHDGRGRAFFDGGGGVSSGRGYANFHCNFHLGVWGGLSSRGGVGCARSSSRGSSIIGRRCGTLVQVVFGVSRITIVLSSVQDMLASPLRIKFAVGIPVVAVFVKLKPGGKVLEDRVAPPMMAVNGGWDSVAVPGRTRSS